MIKAYYNLTKPGIIYGNLLTTIGGLMLASGGRIVWPVFIGALIGISLVVGSACVLNNLADQKIDAKMARTQNRALVTGAVSKTNAIIYALVLLILGSIALANHANNLAWAVALTGFVIYVFIYTPLKPRSVYATLVGSIAGAVPPVVGYVAVSNKLDLGAWLLGLILILWQMPHFYSIAIFRLEDYEAADIPVLPAKKGINFTKINILGFIVVFILAISALYFFHYAGLTYFLPMLAISLYWLFYGLKGSNIRTDHKAWARKMFFISLFVISLLPFSIILDVLVK
ncbi:MAG TPA: heme o synthase [Methylomirabilota bacterium]|nr:heme o synthase [Methylomirabilota bacterium]